MISVLENGDSNALKYHQHCYDQYTHSKSLKIIEQKRKVEDSSQESDNENGDYTNKQRSSSRKRNSGGNHFCDAITYISLKQQNLVKVWFFKL